MKRVTSEILDRTPPHDPGIERGVLASVILDSSRLPKVAALVQPADFHLNAHRTIFRQILEMRGSGGDIDVTLLAERLKRAGNLEAVGGPAYLAEIVESVAVAAHAESYARLVRKKATLRALIHVCTEILRDAYAEKTDPAELVERGVDSFRAAIRKELAGIEFQGIPASQLGGESGVDWIWEGWLAREHITLLVGLWKAGKTTLVAHLLAATARGGDLAGQIQPCQVLVLTEEGTTLWARRRDALGIADNVHFVIRPFKGKPSMPEWLQFVERIGTEVRSRPYDVVVLDTWQTLNPCLDENDAAATMAALGPLHEITEAGAGVLLVHHPRKGDAGEGQAARGSGALPGFVDVIVELRRFNPADANDRRRKLRGLSRFDETPAEVVVELRDEGYVTLGSTTETHQADRQDVIQETLADANEPLTADEVHKRWPEEAVARPGLRTVRMDLNAGCSAGRWNRVGNGKRGDPYRFGVDGKVPTRMETSPEFNTSNDNNPILPESNLNRVRAEAAAEDFADGGEI